MAAALSRGDVAKAHIWLQLGRVSREPRSRVTGRFCDGNSAFFPVIASEAKQSRLFPRRQAGLLRRFAPRNDGERGAPHPAFAIVSFTAATSWLSVKGLGRKSNCWPSGRLFSNASSA